MDQVDLDGRSRRGHGVGLKEACLEAREAEMKPKKACEYAVEYVETSDPPFPLVVVAHSAPAEFCGA